ncbi:MAG: hypothetical protein DSY42_07005, partial [Aquifex sp.]
PPPGPNTTMMGMTVLNEGDEADKLIGVKTDIARKVEIHKTVIENGVAKMVHQRYVNIPPRSKVEFKHHGYHIMIIGLEKRIKAGNKVKVKLVFERSGEKELEVPVIKMHMMEHDMEHIEEHQEMKMRMHER